MAPAFYIPLSYCNILLGLDEASVSFTRRQTDGNRSKSRWTLSLSLSLSLFDVEIQRNMWVSVSLSHIQVSSSSVWPQWPLVSLLAKWTPTYRPRSSKPGPSLLQGFLAYLQQVPHGGLTLKETEGMARPRGISRADGE